MAIYCVVIAAVWQTSGFVMAMFLAGLRGVDTEQVNAAKVDGAKTWQIYLRIVLPQLGPVFVSAFVILAHMAIKSYDLIVALTNGGSGPINLAALRVHVAVHVHAQRDGRRRRQLGADAARDRCRGSPLPLQRNAEGEKWLTRKPTPLLTCTAPAASSLSWT